MKRILQILMALCIVCAGAQAQDVGATSANANPLQAEASHPSLQDVKSGAVSTKTPRRLKGAGAGSPEEAAQEVAKNLAARKSDNQNGQAGARIKDGAQGKGPDSAQDLAKTRDQTKDASTAASDDAVVEFQPAGSNPRLSSPAIKDRPPRASRVHGDLYGSSGAAGHAAGGSAGATSKSGKTSIYVESDQARSTAPQPQ